MASRRYARQPASVSRAAAAACGHGAGTCEPSARSKRSMSRWAKIMKRPAHPPPPASVEGHTQAEVDHVLLPAGGRRPHATLVHVAYAAVHIVHYRRQRQVAAHPDVITRPGGEPPTRAVEGRGGVHVIVRQADAAREEETAPRGGVEVERRRDVRQGLGGRAVGMRPAVYRPAHEQVAAGGAAELHEPGDAPHTRAVHAVVAGDVRPSISQSEADPEAVVPLRVLRPRPGCGAGKRGEQCDHAGRVHAPSLAGVGSRVRRVPCPKRRARARGRGVLARGQANAWGETAYGSDRNGPRGRMNGPNPPGWRVVRMLHVRGDGTQYAVRTTLPVDV